jgi:uncharacterized damage-inducible protein DinB
VDANQRLLVLQLHHMEWADAGVWAKISTLPAAVGDDRLKGLLHHMHLVQNLYLQVWRGEQLTVHGPSSFEDLRALQDWGRSFHRQARAVVAAAAGEAMQRTVHFPWARRLAEGRATIHAATFEESVLQIVLHTTHHRAQVCTRARELGGEPPLIDFIAWVWQGKPEPEWWEGPPGG